MLQSLYSLAATGSFCWLVASSLWIYPHSLSYFNESVGGPLNGPECLLGSAVDWGQDLNYLVKWQSVEITREFCLLHPIALYDPRDMLALVFEMEQSDKTLWEIISVNDLVSDEMLGMEETRADVSDEVVDHAISSESCTPITYSLRVQRLPDVK